MLANASLGGGAFATAGQILVVGVDIDADKARILAWENKAEACALPECDPSEEFTTKTFRKKRGAE